MYIRCMKRSRVVTNKIQSLKPIVFTLLRDFNPKEKQHILKMLAIQAAAVGEKDVKKKLIFNNRYEVHSNGNIYSISQSRLLRGNNSNGYKTYYIDGKNRLGHRLVAGAFLPNPNNHPVVNHLNEIKDDNSIENLEWCSYSENIQYSSGRFIYKNIHCYDTTGKLLKIYKTLKCCEEDGLRKDGVKSVIKHEDKRYYKKMVFSLNPIPKEWFDKLPKDYFDDNRNARVKEKKHPTELYNIVEDLKKKHLHITINGIADIMRVTRQTISNHLTIDLKDIIKDHNELIKTNK